MDVPGVEERGIGSVEFSKMVDIRLRATHFLKRHIFPIQQ